MRRPIAVALAFITLATLAPRAARGQADQRPLRVIRTSPSPTTDATPTQRISVTFDRPVAGSLDQSVDPASIFRLEPAARGRLEWRDPVTIRFTPATALDAATRYTVTIANTFRAMDGSALAEPYRFSFRVTGPRLLWVPDETPRTASPEPIALDHRFTAVYSAPIDLAALSNAAYLELSAACSGDRIVRLDAVSQRRIASDDAYALQNAGGWERDRSADSLRRVVHLVPRTRLPRACRGELVLPTEVAADGPRDVRREVFATYGDFRLLSLTCGGGPERAFCPTGPLTVTFSNPVRGADVARHLHLYPDASFRIRDTLAESREWFLEARLRPRVTYSAFADSALRDVFGQRVTGNPALAVATTGFAPAIIHPLGQMLVERLGFRTLAVQHVNIDTLFATIAPVPDSLVPQMLNPYGSGGDSLWSALSATARVLPVAVRGGTAPTDRALITGIPLPVPDTSRGATSPLLAVRIAGRGRGGAATSSSGGATALVQVTDLGVHARIGLTEGAVWVTGVEDGRPRSGATVVVHDIFGRAIATGRTDARGLARFPTLRALPAPSDSGGIRYWGIEGFVTAQLGADRAVVGINRWDPDLSPWRFNARSAYEDDRLPLAGAVFTERGIYRPTERVHAKAIVRDGALGNLRVPSAGDSIRWLFHDRDEGMLRRVTVPLSAFGTSDQSVELPSGAKVGSYTIEIQARRRGAWRSVGRTGYRVAEYRPPEFLIDVTRGDSIGLPGAPLRARVQARYLFGAPMGRAVASWEVRQTSLSPWEIAIPGVEEWTIGSGESFWDEDGGDESRVIASRADTLDARGEGSFSIAAPQPTNGRPARVTIAATVSDVNRQVVGSSTSMLVFPAEFMIAAKPTGTSYFWTAGAPREIGVLAVSPEGRRVTGVAVTGTVVRREWHRVRRERDGVSELVGDWVSDTVATCRITSSDAPATCRVTPKEGGLHVVTFTASDRAGRSVSTSLGRWVVGSDWVPWSDETQFKMDVVPDRKRYAVGDTAIVLFASPFTNVDGWVTVEREGLIEQRRIRITAGATTLRFPITEAYAPNAFISILVARGRSAPPGSLDDGGRPTIRVGYAELSVTPEVKRLTLSVNPERPEYRPGDSARVSVRVTDAGGHGARSEVTLWAVDEGVLALTGYKTPDPISLIYEPRGLGMRLASNMTSVAPQVPEGEKGRREAGGGGGAAGADVLRSRFRSTAFFLGNVVTDADGNGAAVAKLPDNLTTFRIMAVAVTAGDRYGKGESTMLVTRPLLARQALPRFVREGDVFTAGAVINRRDGAAVPVTVKADATGVRLQGSAERTVTLAAQRGTEVRFPFTAQRGDSATFRFDVGDGTNADAVQVRIPIRPDHHPVSQTIAGTVVDSSTVTFALGDNVDAARSRLTLSVGVSPLTAIEGMMRGLRVYPYDCTEQVTSEALPLIALYRYRRESPALGADPRREIARAVAVIAGRQRGDGGIGYWSATDWTNPWLSAYAGGVLLDARAAGVAVDSTVIARLADYLAQALHGTSAAAFSPVSLWYARRDVQLGDHVAAVDFLGRAGRADVAGENELLRNAAQLSLEDRARLATVFARRGERAAARALMESVWSHMRVDGRRAVTTDVDSARFYFASRVRPYARALIGTLAVDPAHALVGPLAEAVVQQTRATDWYWTTQDYASATMALGALRERTQAAPARSLRVAAGRRVVLESGSAARDSVVPLTGLVTRGAAPALGLSLNAGSGDGLIYYALTVTEVPSSPPVTPEDHGIRVERWYERFDTGTPVTSVSEGDVVRVRLRLTVPTTRTFVVLDDALPGGLEAVDLSLRTSSTGAGPGTGTTEAADAEVEGEPEGDGPSWYGRWDAGWWSPFDHREIRDDRVVYSATMLWPGTYLATYVARATSAGTFIRPPAHAEEMYNPAVYGRSDGGTFVVTARSR